MDRRALLKLAAPSGAAAIGITGPVSASAAPNFDPVERELAKFQHTPRGGVYHIDL